MQDYNLWADLLFTFHSSPDWIKALWLLVPPGFVLAVIWMVMLLGWRSGGGRMWSRGRSLFRFGIGLRGRIIRG